MDVNGTESSSDTHADVVRKSFARQVPLFTGDASPFAKRDDSPLAWLEPLEPHMVLLDVACGAAHAAELPAPRVRQLVGIDLSPVLLQLGAERLAALGIDNVLLQTGDATDLPFVDASFDLVMCRSALHHFDRPEVAIAEMARVTRPGGRVVIADLVAPSAADRDGYDHVHRLLDPSHVRVYLDDEIGDLLQTAVGPAVYAEQNRIGSIPLELIFTDVADRDGVLAALDAELAGGPATGFSPEVGPDGITVSFTSVVVHAQRPSAG